MEHFMLKGKLWPASTARLRLQGEVPLVVMPCRYVPWILLAQVATLVILRLQQSSALNAEAFAHLGDVREKHQIGPFAPLNEWVEKWLPEPLFWIVQVDASSTT